MSVLREFIIDCVSADNYHALRQVGLRNVDTDDLMLQLPAILRACRDLEAMCGLDNINAKMSDSQRLTMLELSDFVTAHFALTHTSNLPFPNDEQLVARLVKKSQKSRNFYRDMLRNIRKSVEIGQTAPIRPVLTMLIRDHKISPIKAYKLYEDTLQTKDHPCTDALFDVLFDTKIMKYIGYEERCDRLVVSKEVKLDIYSRMSKESQGLMRDKSQSNNPPTR